MNATRPDLQTPPIVAPRDLAGLTGAVSRTDVVRFAVFEAAFYLAYRYGMSFSQTTASPFWFPDSVLLCALLLSRPRQWWVLILGVLPIRLFSTVAAEVPLWFLFATFVIDSAKGVLTAAILRRTLSNPIRLRTMRDFGGFCLFAVLLMPVVSGFLGAAARFALDHDYWRTWEQWFLGNALTHLVVTPALLYWVFGAGGNIRVPQSRRWLEGGVLTAGLVLAGHLAFSVEPSATRAVEPRFYAPIPFLFWSAIRFGMFGASGSIMVFAALSVQAALSGRGPFAGQSPLETAMALQQFLLLRAVPVYLVAILTEESRAAERSLRESEERFRIMADTAPVFLWMSGADKLPTFFNRSWLDFTGRTLNQELGNGWAESLHPDDLPHLLSVYDGAFDARVAFEIDYRLRRHDGEYRWIHGRGVPRFDSAGAFAGYIGSAIDITDRKQAEEAQRHLAHAQRLAGMGELTAMLAHEISQPLFAIMNNATGAENLLKAEPLPVSNVRAMLADINTSARRATDAIRRLRSLSRRQDLQMAPLDVNDAIADLVRLLMSDAIRRRVRVRQEFAEGLPAAFGDRAGLQQVAMNLIVNAIEGMSTLPESTRDLTVRTARTADGHIEVTVTDRGPGIATDSLPRLFESFFTTKDGGLGLGLSIARSIVDAHHGRIWAENNASGGATFHFTVPIARVF